MSPATRHKWTHPALTPARQAGTRLTYPWGMESWGIIHDTCFSSHFMKFCAPFSFLICSKPLHPLSHSAWHHPAKPTSNISSHQFCWSLSSYKVSTTLSHLDLTSFITTYDLNSNNSLSSALFFLSININLCIYMMILSLIPDQGSESLLRSTPGSSRGIQNAPAATWSRLRQ